MITPLQAPGDAREVVVTAENWLSGLRLARKQIGEEGGVPPGASCVMAATGEVTIVDMTSRRRFTLSRATDPAAAARQPSATHPPVATPRPAAGQPIASSAPPAAFPVHFAPVATPATPAAQPAASPAEAKVRTSTMAYSPEDSAAIRAQLVAATQPAKRSNTVAYSPEESAAARAQLLEAQADPATRGKPAGAAPVVPAAAVVPPAAPAPAPVAPVAQAPAAIAPIATPAVAPPATGGKRATVAYLESLFAQGSSQLVVISQRDQEPSATSPLLYRERCLFSPNTSEKNLVQQALQRELAAVCATLNPSQRGVFVSLALFDHHYQGKPARGPIATLQWKDWRGEPVFTWHGVDNAPPLPTGGDPVRTSFVPDVTAAPPAPPARAVPQAPAPARPARAPSDALFTPLQAHAGRDSWPPSGGAREATGDHDRRLAVAFEAVQDLYFLGSAAEAMDFGVKLLSELVPCQAVTGCIYDINTNELRFVALTGPGADERRAGAITASAGLLGVGAFSTKESLLVTDVPNDPRFDPDADGRVGVSPRTMLLLPLHKAENVLGVVQLINRIQGAGFNAADAAVGVYVAGQLADFLQSKRTTIARRPR